MSASPARRALRKGHLPPVKRDLLPLEVIQLTEMNRTINGRKWEVDLVRANTALVPEGQTFAEQLEALVALGESVRASWIAATLVKCGYAPGTLCDFNLGTGKITVSPSHEA